jgi:hypothetical protein
LTQEFDDDQDDESIEKQDADAAAEQAEDAAEAKDAEPRSSDEGFIDDEEEEKEEEEEEETMEEMTARLKEVHRQEFMREMQAGGGASATVSLHVSLKRCACLTHCVANVFMTLCVCVCVCRYRHHHRLGAGRPRHGLVMGSREVESARA